MSKLTIEIDVITSYGRKFVVPSQDDIDYDEMIHRNRLADMEKTLMSQESRLEDLVRDDITGSYPPEIKRLEEEVAESKLGIAQIKQLLTSFVRVREKRTQLLAQSDTIKIEFTEPEWGMVASMEEKYRKLVETTGQYVTDRQAAMFALLRKCAPTVDNHPPVVAERMLVILRRYTEVNFTDLPFLC